MKQQDINTLKKWIKDMIKEDSANIELSMINEDYSEEMKYHYSVSRLETVIDCIEIIEKGAK